MYFVLHNYLLSEEKAKFYPVAQRRRFILFCALALFCGFQISHESFSANS